MENIKKQSVATLMIVSVLLAACSTSPQTRSVPAPEITPTAAIAATGPGPDLSVIKIYLQKYGKDYLQAGATTLKTNADQYYVAVKAANFDYKKAWGDGKTLGPLLMNMREAFNVAHTGYESVEGIVAGVPSLSEFDTILDAGAPGKEGGDNIADFSVILPNGAILDKPGNLFHFLLEPMIFGTQATSMKLQDVDIDGDGKIGFGDNLPDANLLKGVADSLNENVGKTNAAINAWQPSLTDAFTAMVVMTPTMDEYFNNWKESRYISGEGSALSRFVAHSRLIDVAGILDSIRTIYGAVKPSIEAKDPSAAKQIDTNYANLFKFVQDLVNKEKAGTRFTPDQAELLGKNAQDQAQTITGQVTQAAGLLQIKLQN